MRCRAPLLLQQVDGLYQRAHDVAAGEGADELAVLHHRHLLDALGGEQGAHLSLIHISHT